MEKIMSLMQERLILIRSLGDVPGSGSPKAIVHGDAEQRTEEYSESLTYRSLSM